MYLLVLLWPVELVLCAVWWLLERVADGIEWSFFGEVTK